MPAQDFGNELRRYIGHALRMALARCIYSFPGFAPAGLTSALVLFQLLPGIMAGDPWPFSPRDLLTFVDAVDACVPPSTPGADFPLRLSAAIYFIDLTANNGPHTSP